MQYFWNRVELTSGVYGVRSSLFHLYTGFPDEFVNDGKFCIYVS